MSRLGGTGFEGDYEISSPAVQADEQRQLVVARQNIQERERAVVRQETSLQQRVANLSSGEIALQQGQLTLQRQQDDARNRIAELERQRRVVDSERQAVAKEREYTRRKEQERRARRTYSEAFLEDTFPALCVADVIVYIGNESARIRRAAMSKLSSYTDPRTALTDRPGFDAVVNGLLPGSMRLIREGKEDVLRFVSTFLVEAHFSLALANCQQCPLILELLVSPDPRTSDVARKALTAIVAGDVQCITALYKAFLPLLTPTAHERLTSFTGTAFPNLIPRALLDAAYSDVITCVTHSSVVVRVAVYPPILHSSKSSAVIRRGLIHEGLLTSIYRAIEANNPVSQDSGSPTPSFLDISRSRVAQAANIPDDLLQFTASFIPSFAVEIVQEDQVKILLDLLCSPHKAVAKACALALRSLSQKDAKTRETIRIALDPYVWSTTPVHQEKIECLSSALETRQRRKL